MKIFAYDLETTGTNPYKNGIHELAYVIIDNMAIVEYGVIDIKPDPSCIISQDALNVRKRTTKDLEGYMPEAQAYQQLLKILDSHVDKYNKKDKMFLLGFNNGTFDDLFMNQFFKRQGNNFFYSYFWSDSLDMRPIAISHLLEQRSEMVDFKLMTVAKAMGIKIIEKHLHKALYDIYITLQIANNTCIDVDFSVLENIIFTMTGESNSSEDDLPI